MLKTYNICLFVTDSIVLCLWRHLFYWEFCITSTSVVLCAVHVSSQPKVSYQHRNIFIHPRIDGWNPTNWYSIDQLRAARSRWTNLFSVWYFIPSAISMHIRTRSPNFSPCWIRRHSINGSLYTVIITYNRKIIKVSWVDSPCSKEGLDRSIGHEW